MCFGNEFACETAMSAIEGNKLFYSPLYILQSLDKSNFYRRVNVHSVINLIVKSNNGPIGLAYLDIILNHRPEGRYGISIKFVKCFIERSQFNSTVKINEFVKEYIPSERLTRRNWSSSNKKAIAGNKNFTLEFVTASLQQAVLTLPPYPCLPCRIPA